MTLRGRRGSVVGALCWLTSFVSGNGDELAPATDEETLWSFGTDRDFSSNFNLYKEKQCISLSWVRAVEHISM